MRHYYCYHKSPVSPWIFRAHPCIQTPIAGFLSTPLRSTPISYASWVFASDRGSTMWGGESGNPPPLAKPLRTPISYATLVSDWTLNQHPPPPPAGVLFVRMHSNPAVQDSWLCHCMLLLWMTGYWLTIVERWMMGECGKPPPPLPVGVCFMYMHPNAPIAGFLATPLRTPISYATLV